MKKKRTIILICTAVVLIAVIIILCLTGVIGKNGKNTADSDSDTAVTENTQTTENLPAETEISDTEQTDDEIPEVSGSDLDEILSSGLFLPDDTKELSYILSLQLLTLSSGYNAEMSASMLESAGFEVLLQKNFDKADDDISHTCAYTLGHGSVTCKNEKKDAFIITVRGTYGGEWFSNFDFAPNGNYEGVFAENFLSAATDIYNGTKESVMSSEEPFVIICGHSRGAAAANILGMLYNSSLGTDKVCVYTFATPATVKDELGMDNSNIFNFISTADLVPELPLALWGYKRAGNDIILEADPEKVEPIIDTVTTLARIAPSVGAYYNDRHSLVSSGISPDGMTSFETMNIFSSMLSAIKYDALPEGDVTPPPSAGVGMMNVSPESDLAPVFNVISNIASGNSEKETEVLAQHMPDAYAELIMKKSGLGGK